VKSAMAQMKDSESGRRSVDTAAIDRILSGGAKVELILLKRVLTSQAEAERILKTLDPADFEDRGNSAFFAYCRKYFEKNGVFIPGDFLNAVHPQEVSRMNAGLSAIDDQNEKAEDVIEKFIDDARTRHRADLIKQLEQAQSRGDAKLAAQLAARVAELKKSIHRKK